MPVRLSDHSQDIEGQQQTPAKHKTSLETTTEQGTAVLRLPGRLKPAKKKVELNSTQEDVARGVASAYGKGEHTRRAELSSLQKPNFV